MAKEGGIQKNGSWPSLLQSYVDKKNVLTINSEVRSLVRKS